MISFFGLEEIDVILALIKNNEANKAAQKIQNKTQQLIQQKTSSKIVKIDELNKSLIKMKVSIAKLEQLLAIMKAQHNLDYSCIDGALNELKYEIVAIRRLKKNQNRKN